MDEKGFWRNKIVPGSFLWKPPPAVAHAVIEQLIISRLKRQESLHIVVIPTLFSHLWRKQLGKACDLVIQIPANFHFWPDSNYEPLTIGICFPFIPFPPWQIRNTPKMFSVGRQVRQMCKTHHVDPGSLLRQLLVEVRKFPTMQESMVWKLLYFKSPDKVLHGSRG